MSKDKGLRVIAILEVVKGGLALIVALGIHVLAGQNAQQAAEKIVTHLHLNPSSHYPNVFIHAVSSINDSQLTFLAIGVGLYSLLRFVEAYGLWFNLRWIEWLALVSASIYLPFEIYEIFKDLNIFSGGTFVINILVVGYLSFVLFGRQGLHDLKLNRALNKPTLGDIDK